ncbi:hypothetical protein ACP70R_029618 [Stipagrostis hirtigluma subsp. patula]
MLLRSGTRLKSRSPPASPSMVLHPPEVPVEAPLPPPKVEAPEQCGANHEDDSSDESVAELGARLFPLLPREHATSMWVGFVNDAKACLKQYNSKNQTNFVYKHAPCNGFYSVQEVDGSCYFHMNFQAQEKDKQVQLFFGEIKMCVMPQVEDVTCCCPVSPSDAGGKGIRTIEEAPEDEPPEFGTVGYDTAHCYACTSKLKHPKGTCYVAGHFAEVRQYYQF